MIFKKFLDFRTIGNYNFKKVIIAVSLLILIFSFGITEAFSLFNLKKDPSLRTEQQLHNLPNFPAIGKKDRIMILAPHPDDEILGTGGVIQKAREVGAPVKIIFLTNGDHDLVTFKIDTGRIVLTPKQYIAMAEKRQQESLSAAILNAGSKIPAPSIFFYLIHLDAWPKPYHYHPEFRMKKIPPVSNPDWNKAIKMENVGASENDAQPELEANLRGVSYLMSNDYLLVKVFLKKRFTVKTGISLYLFGFRRNIPFGAMPKIRLTASTMTTMFAYNGMRKISNLPATLSGDGTELLIEVPLSMLKQPESIFTSLRMHRGDLSLDSTAWHLLQL